MSKASLRTAVDKRKWKGRKEKLPSLNVVCVVDGKKLELRKSFNKDTRAVTHLGRKTASVC